MDQDCDGSDAICALAIVITSPVDFAQVAPLTLAVSGAVSRLSGIIDVNGFVASRTGHTWTALVTLRPGRTVLTATVRDAGEEAIARVNVTQV